MMNRVLSVFYFLHFVPDEAIGMRLILGIGGLFFGFCLLSGYIVWAEKKRLQEGWGGDIFNRVCIAVMLGLIPSSALVLLMHWVLPYEMFDKEMWLRGGFFVSCSFWLFYTVFERSLVKTMRLMLVVSAYGLLGAVIFHGVRTHIFLWNSYLQEMWVPFFVDVTLLGMALFFYGLSYVIERSSFLYRYERQGVFHGF